jgi:hypothetical protein
MSSENNDKLSCIIEKYIDENSLLNSRDFNQLVPGFPISGKSYWAHSLEYIEFINCQSKFLNLRANQYLSIYLYKSLKGDIYVISKVRGKGEILGYTTPKDFFGNEVDPKIFEK